MAKIELKIGDKTYNRKWVDDISSTSQISTDPAGINYGVIPSTGNAKLRDVGGEIRADIESGVLPVSNAPTKVVINGNQIQEHITSDSDYDVINQELNLQFSDRLSLLDNVTYAGMPLRDYSMTAYEMLDDVIGSYGEYAKEKPINWIKYQSADRIITTSGSDKILVNTYDGWEIIGTPIRVTPKKQYTISYSIHVGKAYTTSEGDGIPIQILRSEPTNNDCSSLAIASAFLSKTVGDNIGTITFTPETNIVYLVINFGWASTNQAGLFVNIKSIKVNGNSLADALYNSNCLDIADGIGLVDSNLGNRLDGITIPYPYLPSSSFRVTIEKFCTLGQMTLLLNDGGKILFSDARPLFKDSDENTMTKVENKYKISNLNKTLFLKNKFDGVDIKQEQVIVATNTGSSVYGNEYNTPSSTQAATGGVNNSIFTKSSPLGCAFNAIDRGQSGSDSYSAYAGIDSSWGTYRINIPKHSADNLEQVLAVWTGVDNNKKPYISYSTIYELTRQNFAFRTNKNATEAPTYFQWTSYSETSSHNDELHKVSHTATNSSHTSLTCTISITDEQKIIGMNVTETDDYYTFDVRLQQSTKWYNAESNWSDSLNYSIGNGTLYSANVSAIAITVNGVKKVISFEELDCSSKGIENATNAITIPTSELMQNLSDVEKIKDTIFSDYAGGVATASIDLFCGLKDWENGEIIQPNDILTIEGEDGYWRVTGRTFKYNGSPTLSLDLQKQTAVWRYICGGISSGTISTGNFTTDGTKTGTIKLPSHDYMKYPSRFTVSVVFNENGRTYTQKHTSTTSVRAYSYNALGVFFCNCYITANWSAGTISYTADEKYKKIAGVVRKSYVEKITITSIEQFY